jgi:hypothetical protein
MYNMYTDLEGILSAFLYLHVSFYPRVVNFVDMSFHTVMAKFKYTERNYPKEYQGDPCRQRQVLTVRIWLDFYEDDMSPWALSGIHIQRVAANYILVLRPRTAKVSGPWTILSKRFSTPRHDTFPAPRHYVYAQKLYFIAVLRQFDAVTS